MERQAEKSWWERESMKEDRKEKILNTGEEAHDFLAQSKGRQMRDLWGTLQNTETE